MRLTKDEEKMLSGGYGEATRRAMEILVTMGDYAGAQRMVPVSWADLSTFSGIGGGHGDSPDNDLYKFMKELDDLCDREGVRFRCPTTLADAGTPESNARLTRMGAQLISPAGASSPHDIFPLPLFGQYVTPGATNINTYCNSMIGARGNNEGPIGVRMAAITGRTPQYGYLLNENRLAKTHVEVRVAPKNYIEWAVLGFYISKRLSRHYWDVPVLTGIDPVAVTSDDIMSLCASMNNPGSITHFLIEGLSPESRTLEQALGGRKPKERFTVGPKEMEEVYDTYPPTGNKPEIVTLRFPLTVQRLYEVAGLFEGKKVHKDVSFSVDLTLAAKLVAEGSGLKKRLEAAGVLVAEKQGQVMWRGQMIDPWVDAKRAGVRTMVTDSLKDCNAISQQEIDMVLLPSLERIVEVAVTGKVEGG
ncbi:MAG: aconitase X catalytic domain-containing protein [Actinobacteria bacterium]|nr:aconitase X catalytic domain-containing protein [Actinomycetota bacterium]